MEKDQEMWKKMESLFLKYQPQPTPPPKSQPKNEHSSGKSGHATFEEMIGCKNCWPKIKTLAETKLKAETHPSKEQIRKKAYHCATCNNEVELNQDICGKDGCQSTKTKEENRI